MNDERLAAETPPGPLRSVSVARTLRLSAVAVLAACAATQYLSRVSAPVRTAHAPAADPATTGSIVRSARDIALDPCSAPPLRR